MLELSDALKEFRSIVTDLDKLRAFMSRAEGAADETSRRYLQALGKTIDTSVQELQRSLPETVSYLQQTKAENEARRQQLRATVEELQRQAAEQQQARSQTPPSAAAPARAAHPRRELEVELTLKKYREELFQLLEEHPEGETSRKQPAREIWQDWSRIEDE